MPTLIRRILLFALVLLTLSPAANAQYFGRNKVQWEAFHFKVLQTEHFDIYYYDREADVVEDIGRMAERWYERLSKSFNHSFRRKPIVLYANSADFQQTTTTGGLIGQGTGGFTDEFMNRVVMPLTGDYAENDHVLGHELVHVFQYDIAASQNAARRRFNLNQMPLWIVEGMAEYFSKGRVDPLTAMWVRDATIHNRLPDIRKLTRDPRYFPYRYGQALLAYIGGRFGDEAVVRFFHAAGSVGPEAGLERAIGLSAKQVFNDWHESARELYNPVIQSRAKLGPALLSRKTTRGELNVGPAISPDGRYIAFLSTRELFDIDLFLADAKTGKVIRRLVSADRDAHLEALRFIDSAGSWSPDSRRLAFVVFEKGDNFLATVDVETRNVERMRVPGLDAISNVAWSPDGRTIAISGQTSAVTDLFLYDLESKQVRRLTDDKFADLHPAWSPDGRTIAFVSDRGAGTSLERLLFNEMKISTIDVGSGRIQTLPLFENAKHINPQYSGDGSSIYFIANPDGVSDVYRYTPSANRIEKVTNVQTGVAGITDLSPALSVSRSGDIALSVFEDDHYNIHTLPASTPTQTVAASTAADAPRAAILPPFRATGSAITAYLQRPEEGLPPENTVFKRGEYNPALKVAYVGP
ncbi:MAG TPA: peptidase S9, partial [Thermoanaerobaculia bacterium]|nr:peptidase S9 [Thermoanaerobaculia bacterium]